MREKEVQDLVEGLITRQMLLDRIDGWNEVEHVALDRHQGEDRLLVLDNLVLHRAADAALLVRDRLVGLIPVSNSESSISLNRSEKLFADLLYESPETGTVVVFEIKRARATARETVTELLAYEQEVRNHLPFAARTDICFVVVSTDYSPLLDHSLVSLIAWHGLKVLCLHVDETQRITARLPSAWSSLGQDLIPSQHIDTTSLTFTPHDFSNPVQVGVLLNSALDMIAREADRSGITGFGFVFEDVRFMYENLRPCGLTVARVNPAGFLSEAKVEHYLDGGERSPLHRRIAEHGRTGTWRPASPELDSATRFLSRYGTVEWRSSGTWQEKRRDVRHRTPDASMDHYALPVVFNTWGLIGDYTRELLICPDRMATAAKEFGDQVIETRNPDFGFKVVDTIAPDGKVPAYGAQWFTRLGFRLARLWTYVTAYQLNKDFMTRDRLRSLLAWARADLCVPLTELGIATSLADVREPPPAIITGAAEDGRPLEDPDAIGSLVSWVVDHLIGDKSDLHEVVFEAAFHTGQALDEGIFGIELGIDLEDIIARAVTNVYTLLDLAITQAPRRNGAYPELTAHLAASFGLDCAPDTPPTELAALIWKIPVEALFDEYIQAVPAALDIAFPALHFGAGHEPPTLPSGAVAVLRRRILEHRAAGRDPGIYFDPGGEYGIDMLDEHAKAMFRRPTDDEVVLRDRYTTRGEVHRLTTWTRLTDHDTNQSGRQ